MNNTLVNRNYRYLPLVKLDFIHNIFIQSIKIISSFIDMFANIQILLILKKWHQQDHEEKKSLLGFIPS